MRSDQSAVHADLVARVQRHRTTVHQRPVGAPSRVAFEEAEQWLSSCGRPGIILDTGCGTGQSSRELARQNPDCAVIGIDKSAVRLARGQQTADTDNLLLLRANLLDFMPLARAAHWRCRKLFMLYPNPWPKAAQLNKRWHGSPVFPDAIALGGELELRTNWLIYAQEMQLALRVFGVASELEAHAPNPALTLFESKYQASGHDLWRLTATLPDSSCPTES